MSGILQWEEQGGDKVYTEVWITEVTVTQCE